MYFVNQSFPSNIEEDMKQSKQIIEFTGQNTKSGYWSRFIKICSAIEYFKVPLFQFEIEKNMMKPHETKNFHLPAEIFKKTHWKIETQNVIQKGLQKLKRLKNNKRDYLDRPCSLKTKLFNQGLPSIKKVHNNPGLIFSSTMRSMY